MKLNIIDIPEIIDNNIVYLLKYPNKSIKQFRRFWESATQKIFHVLLGDQEITYMYSRNMGMVKIKVYDSDQSYMILGDITEISSRKFFNICKELLNMEEKEASIPNIFKKDLPLLKLDSEYCYYAYKDSILDKLHKKLITDPTDTTENSLIYGFHNIATAYLRPYTVKAPLHSIMGGIGLYDDNGIRYNYYILREDYDKVLDGIS